MNKHLSFIVYALVLLACLLFLAGIITAGLASLSCIEKLDKADCIKCLADKNGLNKVMDLVASISIVLGTNFGAALGISLTQPSETPGDRAGKIQLFKRIKDENDKIPASEKFRIAACYIYMCGLLISFGFFLFNKDECSAELIPELTKSLGGAVVGALAVFLGVPRPKTPGGQQER